MNAIEKHINQRIEELKEYYPKRGKTAIRRTATIEMLQELTDNIESYQTQAQRDFENFKKFGRKDFAKSFYHNFQIRTKASHRLQLRYRKAIEYLSNIA